MAYQSARSSGTTPCPSSLKNTKTSSQALAQKAKTSNILASKGGSSHVAFGIPLLGRLYTSVNSPRVTINGIPATAPCLDLWLFGGRAMGSLYHPNQLQIKLNSGRSIKLCSRPLSNAGHSSDQLASP